MANIVCKQCSKPFVVLTRGRPPARCPDCRSMNAPIQTESDLISKIASSLVEEKEESKPLPSKKLEKEDGKIYPFEVRVSNVGTVYAGDNENEAEKLYSEYCKKCSHGFGSVGYETTSFFKEGKLIKSIDYRAIIMEERTQKESKR